MEQVAECCNVRACTQCSPIIQSTSHTSADTTLVATTIVTTQHAEVSTTTVIILPRLWTVCSSAPLCRTSGRRTVIFIPTRQTYSEEQPLASLRANLMPQTMRDS